MKLFSVAALLAAVVSTAKAIEVNTPSNVVQCQPLLITWDPQGSAGPFFLSVHPGNNPSAAALYSWDNITGTSFTWVVTVSAGTSLGLLLRDNTGASSQSAPFTVFAGSSTNCSASSSVPGVTSLPPSTGGTSTPLLTPTTTNTNANANTKPPTSNPTSTTSPSSTSTSSGSSGGAHSNAVNFGSAGLLAALVVAVLA